jgi:alkanesulfonate monooxygenase SsuD/methylene tetrahydromethanopterin reductase-like flavin-dependent oxidoreductase (luciferase family)
MIKTVTNKEQYNLGIMFRREHPPEELPNFAIKAEAAEFDELWVVEDCFYGSGIASAAVALAHTKSISVGLGIMPSVVRNPVFTAMEIATLARLYPGRFFPGIGHGMANWMKQIGAFPKSQLVALEEATYTIREILSGKQLDYKGQQVQLNQVELVFPPDQIPPISLGVRGPKSLAISGSVADGTILAEFASPAYVSWAKSIIEKNKPEAKEHRITVLVFACVGETNAAAREQVRPLIASALAAGKVDGQLAPMGIMSEVKKLREKEIFNSLKTAIPNDWIDQLAILGTPENWEKSINNFIEAGADTVVLVPLPDKGLDELELFANHFL